jgi:murein DD-endopeptidase MepM/ murein hydrolase activator NlpD
MATKPVPHGFIISGYGMRTCPFYPHHQEFHPGLDIDPLDTKADTEVVAARDGIVRWIDSTHPVFDPKTGKGSFGIVVYVQGADKFFSIYPHLQSINPALYIGMSITEGTNIGIMGSTGLSTGKHLHYEERISMAPGGSRDPKEISDLYNEPKE